MEGAAAAVVKGGVKEKKVAHAQVHGVELAAKLIEGVRVQAAAKQAAEMLRTQVNCHRCRAWEREGVKTHGPGLIANGAAVSLRGFDERIDLSLGEQFLAVRAVSFAGNAVPAALGECATAARNESRDAIDGGDAQAVHASLCPVKKRIIPPLISTSRRGFLDLFAYFLKALCDAQFAGAGSRLGVSRQPPTLTLPHDAEEGSGSEVLRA